MQVRISINLTYLTYCMTYKFTNETYNIIGAAMEVYNVLGYGFKEEIYQEALEKELSLRNIPFEHQPQIHIFYKGEQLEKFYQADLICYGKIIVELKALTELLGDSEQQLLNYLKATKMEVGMLLNFGAHTGLEHKRMANFFEK